MDTRARQRYLAEQTLHATDAPLCQCGCGQKVLWDIYKKRYKTYLFNHHFRPATNVLLTERQIQIVRGTLLGDGSLQFLRTRSTGMDTGAARLRIRHSTKRQLPLTEWYCHELASIIRTSTKVATNYGFGKQVAVFNTQSHPMLYTIGRELYVPAKTITRVYLDKLDVLGLACWWMDDGSTTAIATHSFTEPEHGLMIQWFRERWDLAPFMDRDKRVHRPFLRFRQPDCERMLRLVLPYVIPELQYKFGRYFLAKWLKEVP